MKAKLQDGVSPDVVDLTIIVIERLGEHCKAIGYTHWTSLRLLYMSPNRPSALRVTSMTSSS
jgi:hypothetical protein